MSEGEMKKEFIAKNRSTSLIRRLGPWLGAVRRAL
jgi:hypothetical protein